MWSIRYGTVGRQTHDDPTGAGMLPQRMYFYRYTVLRQGNLNFVSSLSCDPSLLLCFGGSNLYVRPGTKITRFHGTNLGFVVQSHFSTPENIVNVVLPLPDTTPNTQFRQLT